MLRDGRLFAGGTANPADNMQTLSSEHRGGGCGATEAARREAGAREAVRNRRGRRGKRFAFTLPVKSSEDQTP